MIKVASRYKRLKKMPELMKGCWKFTSHPSIKFTDRLKYCFRIFVIVMR